MAECSSIFRPRVTGETLHPIQNPQLICIDFVYALT
jgi:hypothetical protein